MEETHEGGDLVDLMNLEIDALRKLVSSFDPEEKLNEVARKTKEEEDEEFQVEIIEEELSDNDQEDLLEHSHSGKENLLLPQSSSPPSSSLMARTKSFLHVGGHHSKQNEADRRKSSVVEGGNGHILKSSSSGGSRARSASECRIPFRTESKEVVNTITRKRRFWLSILDLEEMEQRKLDHLTDAQWKVLENSVGNGQGISKEALITMINDLQVDEKYKLSPSGVLRKHSNATRSAEEPKGDKLLKNPLSQSGVLSSPGLKRRTSIKNLILKREKDRSFSVNEKSPPLNAVDREVLRSRSVSVSLFSKKKLNGSGEDSPASQGSPSGSSSPRRKGEYFIVKDYELQRISQQEVESVIQDENDIDKHPVGQASNQKDYWLELGKMYEEPALTQPKLEDVEKYEYYYRDYFFAKKHTNYIGVTENKEYVFISVGEPELKEDKLYYRAFIRNYQCDKREDLMFETPAKNTPIVPKKLKSALAHITNAKKLYKIESPDVAQDLLKYELKMVVTHQKIGVLLRKEGQTTEEEMFNNAEPTSNFIEFLDCLGQTIQLEGMKGFTGGLDVKKNSTGTHSVKTKFHGLEIMYHVSTMLPHFEKDLQQVEKKRHIGNDIVVIVFNDATTAFRPQVMKSEYNHIYFVVQPIGKNEDGETKYRIGSCAKAGTPPFGPLLPDPAVFTRGDQFQEFLMTKLINAERASLYAPSFAPKIRRTRKILLEELALKHLKKK